MEIEKTGRLEKELISAQDAREEMEELLTQSRERETDSAKWIFSLYNR